MTSTSATSESARSTRTRRPGCDGRLLASRELAGRRVHEGVHSDLNGSVDLFANLLLPFSTAPPGDTAASAGTKPLAIGYQGPTGAQSQGDAPACEDPLHPPARPRHDVDDEQAGIDDHVGVDALKEALLSSGDDLLFFDEDLAFLFDLRCRRFDVGRVDSGFDRRVDEVLMRERFERLRFKCAPQNFFDLVSRILLHG